VYQPKRLIPLSCIGTSIFEHAIAGVVVSVVPHIRPLAPFTEVFNDLLSWNDADLEFLDPLATLVISQEPKQGIVKDNFCFVTHGADTLAKTVTGAKVLFQPGLARKSRTTVRPVLVRSVSRSPRPRPWAALRQSSRDDDMFSFPLFHQKMDTRGRRDVTGKAVQLQFPPPSACTDSLQIKPFRIRVRRRSTT
jgi:hypothetical protein